MTAPGWEGTAALCALVFFGGFVDAIAGGGGLISLPAYFAAGLPAHAALATNKFSGVCGTGSAVVRYWRAGAVAAPAALWAAAGALAGSVAGAKLALLAPAAALERLLLVLVPAILVLLLLRHHLRLKPFTTPRRAGRVRLWTASALLGTALGAYDGFFGPGTGTFLTIGFAALLGFGLLTAAANARLANLASNLGSVAVFLWHGKVLFPLALYTAAAGVAGNVIGAHLAVRRGARIIRPLLVVVLVLLLGEIVRRRF